MGHVAMAPWDMLQGLYEIYLKGLMRHVEKAARAARARCEESMGHVARAPWDMLRGLHGTCCEGSMGHVARAPWDML